MPKKNIKKNETKNKKDPRVAIFLGIAVLMGVYFLLNGGTKTGRLTLILDFGGETKTFQTVDSGQKRAWSLLQQATAISGINLEAEKNFLPRSINGKENGEDDKKWNFYVNSEKQNDSPYDTWVEPPAEVMFKFE